MTKSELIAHLTKRQSHLLLADVNLATRHVLEMLSDALAPRAPGGGADDAVPSELVIRRRS